jgi:hypothetical protein
VRPAIGPTFFFGGAEHATPVELAAAFQRQWDTAVDQAFTHRDPVWLGELRDFLGRHRRPEALAALDGWAGTEASGPVTAAMARLLAAMDPGLEPRVGNVVVTPAGLATAAHAVADGRGPAERLADIRDAQVLRLWRGLPGMEEAPAVDERWRAGVRAFDQLAATVAAQVGWPTPAERDKASARLLLHALGGRHERQQAKALRSARRTSAAAVPWWSRLAEEGAGSPAAAVLAVMTGDRARAEGDTIRRAEEERRRVEEARRAAARPQPPAPPPGTYRPPPPAAARPAPPGVRMRPLPKAHGFVRKPFGLAVAVAALGLHLWILRDMGDRLAWFFARQSSLNPSERAFAELERGAGFVAFVLVLCVAAHVAARALEQGRSPTVVRAYALGAAATDFLLAFALWAAIGLAGLVVQVVVDDPFPDPFVRPVWGGLAVTHGILAFVALWLVVRAPIRFLRALLGRPVGHTAPPPR